MYRYAISTIKVKYSRGAFKKYITSTDAPELSSGERQQQAQHRTTKDKVSPSSHWLESFHGYRLWYTLCWLQFYELL